MATMSEMEYLLGKAIIEANFRAELINDPEAAAKRIGLTLTTAQAAAIKQIDASMFEQWASRFMALTDFTDPDDISFATSTTFLW